MKQLMLLALATGLLTGCGEFHQSDYIKGIDGTNGSNGYSVGMLPAQTITCSAGVSGSFLQFVRTDTLQVLNAITVVQTVHLRLLLLLPLVMQTVQKVVLSYLQLLDHLQLLLTPVMERLVQLD
jgi:hypothetical protein